MHLVGGYNNELNMENTCVTVIELWAWPIYFKTKENLVSAFSGIFHKGGQKSKIFLETFFLNTEWCPQI